MKSSVLEQFRINPLLRIYNNYMDLTITNSTIYILISIILIYIMMKISLLAIKSRIIINNNLFTLIKISFIKTESIIIDLMNNPIIASKYIPFLLTLFLFILFNNFLGLIPYSFTTTSHIILTLFFSLSIMIATTYIGIKKHNLIKFLGMFIPKGLNEGKIKYLIPLIFIIELISYLFRIISLSVRLTANLLSGHTLIKILSSFGLKYTFFKPYVLLLIPILILFFLFILEFAVSLIQAYVFTLLTTIYIKDAELLH
jgi:ATP synthase subunit 6